MQHEVLAGAAQGAAGTGGVGGKRRKLSSSGEEDLRIPSLSQSMMREVCGDDVNLDITWTEFFNKYGVSKTVEVLQKLEVMHLITSKRCLSHRTHDSDWGRASQRNGIPTLNNSSFYGLWEEIEKRR